MVSTFCVSVSRVNLMQKQHEEKLRSSTTVNSLRVIEAIINHRLADFPVTIYELE